MGMGYYEGALLAYGNVMTLEVGDRAPDFSLKGIDGLSYTLSQALGRGPVALVFFKTTCDTCELAFPYINRLVAAYPQGGYQVWAIAQDPAEEAREYAARHGITYPVLPDVPNYPVSREYDPPATPTLFLVGSDGSIAFVSSGFSKDDLNEVSRLLALRLGAEPQVVAPRGDGRPDFQPGCSPRH